MFAEVYELNVDEDVNKVLFALSKPLPSLAGTAPAATGSKLDRKRREGGKGSHSAMPPHIADSATAVDLLMPRLLGTVSNMSQQQQSELEGMLINLVVCK